MVAVKVVVMTLVMVTTRAAANHGQHNEAVLLTSVDSISLFPLLQCWRFLAVSHLLSFRRTSCGAHLCASLRACYLGGTRMAVLTQSSQLLHELDPSSHLVTMRKQCATVAYPTAHRSVGLCHHVSL